MHACKLDCYDKKVDWLSDIYYLYSAVSMDLKGYTIRPMNNQNAPCYYIGRNEK